jgi:hypothetical protein
MGCSSPDSKDPPKKNRSLRYWETVVQDTGEQAVHRPALYGHTSVLPGDQANSSCVVTVFLALYIFRASRTCMGQMLMTDGWDSVFC